MEAVAFFPLQRVLCLAVFIAGGWLGLAGVHAQNERDLLAVWNLHTESPDNHTANIESCRAFLKANPNDQFVPVAQGIEAWHLLRSGKTEEALKLLEPQLGRNQTSVERAAAFYARSWLTRRDRERVVEALQDYYRHEVGFPRRLEEVTTHPKIARALHPPLKDRFGNSWRYSLVGFGKLEGFANQRYSLESNSLGEFSDFQKAVQAPYGSEISLTPAQVLSVAGQQPAVQFRGADQEQVVLIGLGQEADGVFLAYVGNQVVVVCDSMHWKIFSRP